MHGVYIGNVFVNERFPSRQSCVLLLVEAFLSAVNVLAARLVFALLVLSVQSLVAVRCWPTLLKHAHLSPLTGSMPSRAERWCLAARQVRVC